MNKQAKRLGRTMLPVFQAVDAKVAAHLANGPHRVSCKAGCAHCCYLMPLTTLAEGTAAAEHVLSDPQARLKLPTLLKRIETQLRTYRDLEFNGEEYARRMVPCALLGGDNRCTVYPARPSTCRYYYVVSDPTLCATGNVEIVAKVNLLKADIAVLVEATRAEERAGLPACLLAPLPMMLYWGFRLLEVGPDGFVDGIRRARGGIYDLIGWQKLAMAHQLKIDRTPSERAAMDEALREAGFAIELTTQELPQE